MAIDPRFVGPLKDLVHQLVNRDFDRIAADGRIGNLTVEQVAKAIDDYPATLVDVPEDAFRLASVYELRGQDHSWHIDLPLWTSEEGRSDLTLSVEIIEVRGKLKVTMRDVHVL
jgi:hypothetical protein